MLILSRKLGESILLGDDIEVSVIDVSKGVVRLGIEAPKDIVILRKELSDAVKEANVKAVKDVALEELNLLSKKIVK